MVILVILLMSGSSSRSCLSFTLTFCLAFLLDGPNVKNVPTLLTISALSDFPMRCTFQLAFLPWPPTVNHARIKYTEKRLEERLLSWWWAKVSSPSYPTSYPATVIIILCGVEPFSHCCVDLTPHLTCCSSLLLFDPQLSPPAVPG